MAALRSGIKTVIIHKENEKDLSEIDQTVRRALHFIVVEHVDAVIGETLTFPDNAEARNQVKRNTFNVTNDTPGAKAGIRQ